MTVDLNKGGEFNLDLTKQVNFDIALQWAYNRSGVDIDLDVSAFMLKQSGDKRKLTSTSDIVFFNNKQSACGSVKISGDSRDGASDGDDEVISINTSLIPADVAQINIYINIFAPKVTFSKVDSAKALVRTSDGRTVAQVNMSTDFQNENSLFVGSISKVSNNWTFTAGGEGYVVEDLNTIAKALHTEGV